MRFHNCKSQLTLFDGKKFNGKKFNEKENVDLKRPAPALIIAALLLIQILFGMNYVISKVVVTAFPPLLWASIRIIVSALMMLGVCLVSGRPRPEGGREFFIPMIGFALLGAVINQGSFLVGLSYTTSTNSAVLNTMIPIFTLLIVTVRGQEKLTLWRGVGFFCAFLGVLILRKVENLNFSDQTLIGDLLTILNCLSYGLFLSYSKKFVEKHDRVWVTTWLFLYGSVGLTGLALPYWAHFQMPVLTPTLMACMVFAILGGTLLTYFLNIWTLAYSKPSQVAVFIYFQPIVAALLAWGWLGEIPTLRTLASSVMIFTGVMLAMFSAQPTS